MDHSSLGAGESAPNDVGAGASPATIFSVAEVADGVGNHNAAGHSPTAGRSGYSNSVAAEATRLRAHMAASNRTMMDIDAYLAARRPRHGREASAQRNTTTGDDGGPPSGASAFRPSNVGLFSRLADMDSVADRRHGVYLDLGDALESARSSASPSTSAARRTFASPSAAAETDATDSGPAARLPRPHSPSTSAFDSLRARIDRQDALLRASQAASRDREATVQARMRSLDSIQQTPGDDSMRMGMESIGPLDPSLRTDDLLAASRDGGATARDALDRLQQRVRERIRESSELSELLTEDAQTDRLAEVIGGPSTSLRARVRRLAGLENMDSPDSSLRPSPSARNDAADSEASWLGRRERTGILPPLPEASSADAVDIEMNHGEPSAGTRPEIFLPINSDIIRLRSRATRGTGAGTSNVDVELRQIVSNTQGRLELNAASRARNDMISEDGIEVWQPSYIGPADAEMEAAYVGSTEEEEEDAEEAEEDQSMDEDQSDEDDVRTWMDSRLGPGGYPAFVEEVEDEAGDPTADDFARWMSGDGRESAETDRLGYLARTFMDYARNGPSTQTGSRSAAVARAPSRSRVTVHTPTNGGSARRYAPTIVAGDRPPSAQAEFSTASRRERSMSTMPSMSGLNRRKSMKRRRVDPELSRYSVHSFALGDPLPATALPQYIRTSSHLPIHYLPSMFNELDKSERLALTTGKGKDGSRQSRSVVTFIGTGERGDADAAAVRTDFPIPSSAGVFYFEAQILDKGQEGYISVGFMMRWSNLSRLVGWDPGSFGWHMDDGFVFESRGEGTNRGWPTSTTGDTVGCGIDFTTGQAFFTRNGELIGHAFSDMQNKEQLYPAVGLRTPRERVQINLSGPFVYDIDSHVQRVTARVQSEVAATPPTYSLEPRAVDTWLSQTEEARKAEADAQAKRQQEEDAATNPIVRTSSLRRSRRREIDEQRKQAERPVRPQGLPCPLPRKPIEDVESAIAPSILQYLSHGGCFKASAALAKALDQREKNSIRKGSEVEAVEHSVSMVDATRGDKPLDIRLFELRDLVRGGQDSVAFELLSNEHAGFAKENPDWLAMLLVNWFLKLLRQMSAASNASRQQSKTANDDDDIGITDISSATANGDDVQFAFKHLGLALASDAAPSSLSVLDLALHAGRYLQEHLAPQVSPHVGSRIQQALSLLAYASVEDAPAQLKDGAVGASRDEVSEQLLNAMRSEWLAGDP